MHCHLEDSDGRWLCNASFNGSYFWFVDRNLPGHIPPLVPIKHVTWADLTGDGGRTGPVHVQQMEQGSPRSRMPDVWHCRYCHISPDLLRKTQGAVKGLSLPAGNLRDLVRLDGQCVDCHLGKMPAKSHRPIGHFADRPLSLVHFDLVGKMDIGSVDGYLCALTCIDEFTRYSYVRILRKKSRAHEACVQLFNLRERQTDYKIACVRTDGGKEFSRLTPNCDSLGIVHQVTAPHDHQANGKVERLNRILV